VGRALDFEHGVVHGLAAARQRLLQLGLVVDVAGERVLDATRERLDDRLFDGLETMLEEERGQCGLQQRREDVAVMGEPVELVVRDVRTALGEPLPELELTGDDGATGTGDDVGADLREPSLAEIRIALVQLARDRELEDAVAQELQPLVGRGPLARPGRVRVDLLRPLVGQLLDQLCELGDVPARCATGVTRRSRRPGRRSESSGRPRRRS
jgi:hypothetical protein